MPPKGWKGYKPNTKCISDKKRLKNIDSKMKGSIAESFIAARLSELGFDVWIPYMNNHKSDMAICVGNRFIKIQAKSAGFDVVSDRFRVMLTTKDKHKKHIKYEIDTQDFFIIKCEGLWEFYIVPSEIGIKHHSLNFYPHRNRLFCKGFDAEIYRNAFELIKKYNPW